MLKLNGVMIGSENPSVLGDFYTKIFGEPGMQQGDWYGYGVGNGFFMVGPHSEVKGKNEMPGRIIVQLESADLHDEFERIKELGAKVIAEPYQPDKENMPDAWLATFADPDNNYFQLATPFKM